MAWWDSLFLNEGFGAWLCASRGVGRLYPHPDSLALCLRPAATRTEYLGVNATAPQFQIGRQFQSDDIFPAMTVRVLGGGDACCCFLDPRAPASSSGDYVCQQPPAPADEHRQLC